MINGLVAHVELEHEIVNVSLYLHPRIGNKACTQSHSPTLQSFKSMPLGERALLTLQKVDG